jgi:uncharacterized protein (DUF1810 family)
VDDPFDLARFVAAQRGVYERALSELESGTKRSHWMWFVFPQLTGLGRSATAQRYAISSLMEARAYLAHAVLGVRLRECTRAVNSLTGRSLVEIFGSPDDLKFCSSMTLFERADGEGTEFSTALDKHCAGRRDELTLRLLGTQNRNV